MERHATQVFWEAALGLNKTLSLSPHGGVPGFVRLWIRQPVHLESGNMYFRA